MPSKTNSITLLFLLLILPWSSFGQMDNFLSYVTRFSPQRIETNVIDNQLFIFEINTSPFETITIKVMNDQYTIINEKSFNGVSDFIQLEDGTIFLLRAQDYEIDFPMNPPNFSIRTLDENLEEINYSPLTLYSPEYYYYTTGRFTLMPDNNIFVAYRNWRIFFDTKTYNYTVLESDNFFDQIEHVGITPDSNFLIKTDYSTYHLYESVGSYVESFEIYTLWNWKLWEGHMYGVRWNKLYIHDSNLEVIDSLEFSENINKIYVTNSNKLHIQTKNKIHELTSANSEPILHFENSYESESIIKSFILNDTIGLILNEFPSIPTPGHVQITIRKGFQIEQQNLPNLKIEIQSINPIYSDTMDQGSFGISFWVSLGVEYEIENIGDFPISAFHIVTMGNCRTSALVPLSYCSSSRFELDSVLLPNEKVTLYAGHGWDWVGSLGKEYDICISIINPNFEYDKDYSQNHACTSIFISSTDNINYFDHFTLFPNPTNDVITLRFPQDVQAISDVHIYNCQNQLMLHQKNISTNGSDQVELNTSDFPVGIYWLQAESDKGMLSKKFVKVE